MVCNHVIIFCCSAGYITQPNSFTASYNHDIHFKVQILGMSDLIVDLPDIVTNSFCMWVILCWIMFMLYHNRMSAFKHLHCILEMSVFVYVDFYKISASRQKNLVNRYEFLYADFRYWYVFIIISFILYYPLSTNHQACATLLYNTQHILLTLFSIFKLAVYFTNYISISCFTTKMLTFLHWLQIISRDGNNGNFPIKL